MPKPVMNKRSKKKAEVIEDIEEDELTECQKRNIELQARIDKLED